MMVSVSGNPVHGVTGVAYLHSFEKRYVMLELGGVKSVQLKLRYLQNIFHPSQLCAGKPLCEF